MNILKPNQCQNMPRGAKWDPFEAVYRGIQFALGNEVVF